MITRKRLLSAVVISLIFVFSAHAGELYDNLSGELSENILFELFQKESFSQTDVLDLDALFEEYGFTEEYVIKKLRKYYKYNIVTPTAYQEVILYHLDKDTVPPETSKEEFEYIGAEFHATAARFGGGVRLIGGFLDSEGKGFCRWTAPNTFIMLYIVRQVRQPILGGGFPSDGGTMVTQTLH